MVLLGLCLAAVLAVSPVNLAAGPTVSAIEMQPTASARGLAAVEYPVGLSVAPNYSQNFDYSIRKTLNQNRWTDPTVSLVVVTYPGSGTAPGYQEQLRQDIDGRVSRFWVRELGGEFSLRVGRTGRIQILNDPCQDQAQGSYALPDEGLLGAVRDQLPAEFLASRHLVLAWERSETCGNWAGMALVNHDPRDRGLLWINGPSSDRRIRESVIAHEFGHAFGFGHANYLRCVDSQGKRVSDGFWHQCTGREYGNTVDIMGSSGRLAPLSAAALVGTEWEPRLQAAKLDPQQASTVSLAPLTSTEGPKAGIFRLGDRTYVFEYRRAIAGDSALGNDSHSVGEGVYLNVREQAPDRASLVGEGRPGPSSWSTYVLDGDLSTPDKHGRGSWHIPLYEPLALVSGGHLTVTKIGERATVHYTPPGEATPVPARPAAPKRFVAKHAPGLVLQDGESQKKPQRYLWVSWQGDGQGTDFLLEAKQGRTWVPISYSPVKPGQPHVQAWAQLPRGGWTKVRVAARNEAGSSKFTYVSIT